MLLLSTHASFPWGYSHKEFRKREFIICFYRHFCGLCCSYLGHSDILRGVKFLPSSENIKEKSQTSLHFESWKWMKVPSSSAREGQACQPQQSVAFACAYCWLRNDWCRGGLRRGLLPFFPLFLMQGILFSSVSFCSLKVTFTNCCMSSETAHIL